MKNVIVVGECKNVCPEACISNDPDYVIDGSGCIECGRCYEHCPVEAIDKPMKF